MQDDFGNRSGRAATIRMLGGVGLCFLLILLEVFFGAAEERRQREALRRDTNTGWALDRYSDPANAIAIPPKTTAKRIVYMSNSHAFTGGRVSRHLQHLLDAVCPHAVEIVDLSNAGMFAPEFLQRFVFALSFKPDGVILAPSYISFSDRMGLARQASTARSMFKPDVFRRLPLGFWRRNYDLRTYATSFVAQYWKTYRYRNTLRNVWEQPALSLLNRLDYQGRIPFLEADEYQLWRFPDGFDRNLFQWRLYASGRQGHMADLEALVRLANRHRIPVYGFNLPVHWEKSVYPHDPKDVALYRRQLARLFKTAYLYHDYEDSFPKTFTTYDAMHPTWHGARLHALDIALRLLAQHQLDCHATSEQVFAQFGNSDQAVSAPYRQAFSHIASTPWRGFLRYDFSEPENVPKLLSRFLSTGVMSAAERRMLQRMIVRLRYWFDMPFVVPENPGIRRQDLWRQAVREEIRRARARLRYFAGQLTRLQQVRLKQFPIPRIDFQQDLYRKGFYKERHQEFPLREYMGPGNTTVVTISTPDGKPFLYKVLAGRNHGVNLLYGRGRGYERIDLLGDGSFLLARPLKNSVLVPYWVEHDKPIVGFGI